MKNVRVFSTENTRQKASETNKIKKNIQRPLVDVIDCNYHSNTPPQSLESPSARAKCLTLALGRALVSVSATISSVGQ